MSRWKVKDHWAVELEDVRQAMLRVVAGEAVVTTAPGPPRLEVTRECGPPVEVSLDDGRLLVEHQRRDGIAGLLGGMGSRCRCSVVLSVPPSVRADVAGVSASVVVSGLTGRTRVKTVSGDLTLSRLAEEVDVKTVSGDVQARDLSGDLKVGTVSGDVSVVDGACRWVEASAVSADVLLDLELDPNGVYHVKTVSGDVSVRTQAEPSFLLEARSVSGDILSDLGLAWEDERPGRRRLRERIGAGDARLIVQTVSGDLRLLRQQVAA